jgi:hypothetical protein
MEVDKLITEIRAAYERHGWKLRRVLLTPDSRAAIDASPPPMLAGAEISEAEVDALWFARPSHGGREAWELRLVAEQPYALFEAFESDETEAEREEARREMENRMREFCGNAAPED